MYKVYIPGRHRLDIRFPTIYNSVVVEKPEEADIIVLLGGTDISPLLYGESHGKNTQRSAVERDLEEIGLCLQFPKTFKLGICRGAQLLTVFNGGKLVQHVDGHHRDHDINLLYKGESQVINVTSVHHQMMNPFMLSPKDYQILGWSVDNFSTVYLDGNNEHVDMPLEPEIIWFPKTRSLAVQSHPEFQDTAEYFVIQLNKIIVDLNGKR